MNRATKAGIAAAVLLLLVAGLQVALALGAPFGEAVMGGRAPTTDRVLEEGYRGVAAGQGLFLVLLAVILLGAAGVIRVPCLGERLLGAMAWGVAGLMVLNTLGNLASSHPFERWVLGGVTVATAALSLVVARERGRRTRTTGRRTT